MRTEPQRVRENKMESDLSEARKGQNNAYSDSLPGSTVENPTVGPLWRGPGADEQARHLPSPSPFKFPTVRYLHVLYRKPGGGSRRQL